MPGSTTNFGIRYPCSGENVDAGMFSTWSSDIDAALLSASNATQSTLHRPRASVETIATGNSTTLNVPTTLTTGFSTIYADQVTVSPTQLTSTVSGVYMVTAEFSPLTAVTDVNYGNGAIRTAFASKFYARRVVFRAPSLTATSINVSGLLVLLAGNFVSAQWTWGGAGGPMFVYCNLSMSLVCEI